MTDFPTLPDPSVPTPAPTPSTFAPPPPPPKRRRKRWPWIVGGAAVVVLIAAIANPPEDEPETVTEAPVATEAAPATTQAPATATEAPAATEAPVVTEAAPAPTEAPVVEADTSGVVFLAWLLTTQDRVERATEAMGLAGDAMNVTDLDTAARESFSAGSTYLALALDAVEHNVGSLLAEVVIEMLDTCADANLASSEAIEDFDMDALTAAADMMDDCADATGTATAVMETVGG
jgi:hypothetical protein